MAITLKQARELSTEITTKLAGNQKEWREFLRTAANLYKYPFDDQFMIYAQRPDANAVASFETWKKNTNRYIKKGSKGIAVLDDNGTSLHYVFDISDTGEIQTKDKSKQVTPPWKMKKRHTDGVFVALESEYAVTTERKDPPGQLREVVKIAVDGMFDELLEQMQQELSGSFLEDLPQEQQAALLRETIENSAAYMVFARMGVDPELYLDGEDFENLWNFNTPELLSVIGSATNLIAMPILRVVEQEVKRIDREQEKKELAKDEKDQYNKLNTLKRESERSDRNGGQQLDLHTEGGLPLSKPDRGETAGGHREVRQPAQDVSKGTPTGNIQRDEAGGDTVSPSLGSERDSAQAPRSDDGRNAGERPATGQDDRPDGLGTAHQHDKSDSGRNHHDGTHIQLSFFESLPTIPAEENQIASLKEAEELTSASFSLPPDTKLGERYPDAEYLPVTHFSAPKMEIWVDEYFSITLADGSSHRAKLDALSRWESVFTLDTGQSFRTRTPELDYLVSKHPDNGKYRAGRDVRTLRAERGFESNYLYRTRDTVSLFDTLEHYEITGFSETGVSLYHQETAEQSELSYETFEKELSRTPELEFINSSLLSNQAQKTYESKRRVESMLEQAEQAAAQWERDNPDPESSEPAVEPPQDSFPPVFFVDWAEAKKDFDLTRYQDGDVIGYDKDGKKYTVGKSGDLAYISTTGALWGGNHVPSNIAEQISAYKNGDVTPEQVRVQYLSSLSGKREIQQIYEQPIFETTIKDSVLSFYEKHIPDYQSSEKEKILTDIDEIVKTNDHQKMYQYLEQLTERMVDEEAIENAAADFSSIIHEMEENDTGLQEKISAEIETESALLDDYDYQQTHPGQRRDTDISFISSEAAAKNFRITDDQLGEGGAKTKYQYNITAIRTLKQIEAEGRSATPAEQDILSRYVGWGGIPQAFDSEKSDWAKEYSQLKEILSPEEYAAARKSTLNAHYTSPTVIKAIYQGIQQLGFQGGNLLEPAMGVGNFFGLMPETMGDVRQYGVELDSISGRIAEKLYPKADIQVKGFEETEYPDAFFDVAIGNVPFGNYPVPDKQYDKLKLPIHDYFFAKTLDKVRPGGVMAFVTSKGTMDKADSKFREYLGQRAELLGAVRLPNNTFQKNAGTEVTTDILFLKKRDRILQHTPEWAEIGKTEDGIPVNRYFAEHPEMLLGKMEYDRSMYGDETDTACHPLPDADLAELLKTAIGNIQGEIEPSITLDDVADLEAEVETIPADPHVRNFSYTEVDGKLFFRENSIMRRVDPNQTAAQRIRGLIEIRDCTRHVIDLQVDGFGDEAVQEAQRSLNHAYDRYTAKYGLLSSMGNKLAFSEDDSYPLLCSLEDLDDEGKLKSKADLFSKRTIRAYEPVTHVETAREALAVSLCEKACVDLRFMSSLMDEKNLDVILEQLDGLIFKAPHSDLSDQWTGWQAADEYLSGNVREKLAAAKSLAEENPDFSRNVRALEEVQPTELKATEISVRLGTTWIPKEDYTDFLHEILGVPENLQDSFHVHYLESLNEYKVKGKYSPAIITALENTYGTKRINALTLLGQALNQKTAKVYDKTTDVHGNETRTLNAKETAIAQNRQEKLKRAFKDWIWKEPERRERLCHYYNETFNSVRPRVFDGAHLSFPGMNPEVKMRPHQKDGAARILYGGTNALLAHVVGAGKTYTMAAATMEMKRLGIAQKSLYVVPSYLTEQWGAEFLKLYPGAKVLVATKKDFEKSNRKKFCSRIATGNYDAIVIGHSQFERIPLSKERQMQFIQDEVDIISDALDEMRRDKDTPRYTIKQMEKTRENLKARIKTLMDDDRKDSVVTFEELGIDRLFVDEAHAYKNLYLHTKMQNVAGISSSPAQRSSDMYMKTGFMDELTGGKGTVFATGTPVSNSMTELYTMQRYLMRDRLMENHLAHFDQWATTFGDTQTALELAPEGTGFRMKTRFAKFHNLPELVNMFKEVADIQTADTLDLPRPIPHYHDVVIEPSEYQQELIEGLADRADMVRSREVDPREDNMLKITTDGRKAALDQRLANALLPDDENSKANHCTRKIAEIHGETAGQKSTQLVFCDLSTPDSKSIIPMKQNEQGEWEADFEHYTFRNIYEDLKVKLIQQGVPEKDIAFIHDAKTDKQKAELFSKVREGEIRVLIGSTSKMGAGMNVQDKLIALHHLDVPWKPSDIEQQEGRILRQGNDNKEVDIFRYITKGTFDSYSWQILENKQKFIGQIMTSKSPARSCDDVDATALSYAEIKAQATGDPHIKEKMDLDVQLANLRTLKADYNSQKYQMEDDLVKNIPRRISEGENRLSHLEKANETLKTHPISADSFMMKVDGVSCTERKQAGEAIIALCKSEKRPDGVIGSFRGFDLRIAFDEFANKFKMEMKNQIVLSVDISGDAVGTVTRMANALERIPELIRDKKQELDSYGLQQAAIREELKKEFPYSLEIEEKEERLQVLVKELSEADKERAAKRALQRGEQTAENDRIEIEESIGDFLDNFEPEPVRSGAGKIQDNDLTY